MKFENLLDCLEDDEKCQELILRLERAGEFSKPAKDFMKLVTMVNQPSFFSTLPDDTLQHVFHMCDPLRENFFISRLVCKNWRNAIENLSINKAPEPHVFLHPFVNQINPNRTYVPKYLQRFRKLDFCIKPLILQHWGGITHMISVNMSTKFNKLNTIKIYMPSFDISSYGFTQQPFETQMLTMHHKTLVHLQTPLFNFCHLNLKFPHLQFVKFSIDSQNIQDFAIQINLTRTNCPCLRTYEITVLGNNIENFANLLLANNFGDNCIAATVINFARFLPIRIAKNLDWLRTDLFKFPDRIEYLEFKQVPFDEPIENGWEHYKAFFANFPNLKGICLNGNSEQDFLNEQLGGDNAHVWRERILYLKLECNIRIMLQEDLCDPNLELPYAPDNQNWIFRFY